LIEPTEFGKANVCFSGDQTMSKLGIRVSVLVFAALVTIFSVVANAQETTGSISGTISDASGASVKGAVVTLTNTDRGQDVRTLTTNSAGFYTATSLPLGTYSVKVSAGGFKSEVVTGLALHVNDALTVNRTLVVGNAGETVTVTADQVQLNLENGMSQGLINGTQIRELALNNRNYEQLLLLQPGVSYGGASDQLYIGTSLPAGTSSAAAPAFCAILRTTLMLAQPPRRSRMLAAYAEGPPLKVAVPVLS